MPHVKINASFKEIYIIKWRQFSVEDYYYATHIKFKGLHGCPVGPWDRRKESQHLFDDTIQVLEADDGVQPELSFGAEAAIVEEAPGSQLLS